MAKKELEKNQEKMRRSSGMPRTPLPSVAESMRIHDISV
jgi:hypothetical protein